MFPQEGYEKREPFAVRSERFLQIEIDNARNQTEKLPLYQKGMRHPLCSRANGTIFGVPCISNLQICVVYAETGNDALLPLRRQSGVSTYFDAVIVVEMQMTL